MLRAHHYRRDNSYRRTNAWKVLQAHGFGNNHRELSSIAGILAMETRIPMTRKVKRVKGDLVRWFDENLSVFVGYLDRFHLESQGEERVLYYRDQRIVLEDHGWLPVEFRVWVPTFDARTVESREGKTNEELDQFIKDVVKPGRSGIVWSDSLEIAPLRKL
jgi:hypothetical protein